MLPIQEMKITTKNSAIFRVHLENHSSTSFKISIATVQDNKANNFSANGTYETIGTEKESAELAFKELISLVNKTLDATDDLIIEVDNICNTELLDTNLQKLYLNDSITVKVNGV